MSDMSTDILMITHNRPRYTEMSLARLLESCDASTRVWLWHNGNDAATLEVVRRFASHPRVHEFHHSPANQLLRIPTNWFWSHAKGQYLAKVDDDCLVPDGWLAVLRKAHQEVPAFGIIGCWIYQPEDYIPELANPRLKEFPAGHRVLQNLWLGGSGYLIKRQCREQNGLLRESEAFSKYCIRAAAKGWVNGWYYPLLYMDHMDDPRSPNTMMKTDEDFQRNPSLSSRRFGTSSLEMMRQRARRAAIEVQQSSLNPGDYIGWRRRVRSIWTRLTGRARVARFDA